MGVIITKPTEAIIYFFTWEYVCGYFHISSSRLLVTVVEYPIIWIYYKLNNHSPIHGHLSSSFFLVHLFVWLVLTSQIMKQCSPLYFTFENMYWYVFKIDYQIWNCSNKGEIHFKYRYWRYAFQRSFPSSDCTKKSLFFSVNARQCFFVISLQIVLFW